jgi:signal transduction histidine kinase/ligand-binding sensor domain-containing protein
LFPANFSFIIPTKVVKLFVFTTLELLKLLQPRFWNALFLCFFFLFSTQYISAEVFPVKTYTTADGLLRDNIYKIKQDSRGFIWFLMQGGISRFDGYAFTNYTMDDGLPSLNVNELLETNAGTIWISTNVGLVKFNPKGIRQKFDKKIPTNPDSMFQVFAPSEVKSENQFGSIIEDKNKILWASTTSGLLKIEIENGQPIFSKTEINFATTSLLNDSKGNLWVGTWEKGLFLITPDGNISQFTENQGLPQIADKRLVTISAFLEDQAGRIWIGGRNTDGICRLVQNPQTNQNIVENYYTQKDGLSNAWVNSLSQSADRTIWIPTVEKLTQLKGFNEQGKPNFRILDDKNGLTDKEVNDFLEDRDGNFWIATSDGVKKISKYGFTKFDENDGLPLNATFAAFFDTNGGEIVGADHPNERNISVFRNGKFTYVKPNYPPEIEYWGWGANAVLQTHDGEWWITVGSSDGQRKKYGSNWINTPLLVRFPKVDNIEDLAKIQPKKIYRISDIPNTLQTMQLYEDKRSDIWIMALGNGDFLYRWDRKTDSFIDYRETLAMNDGWFGNFAEDNSGNLWIAGSVSSKSNPGEIIRLLRYKDGKFQVIQIKENFEGSIRNLFVDSKGSLWVATTRYGLARLDDVNAETPQFVFYGTAEGLSDNLISTITEDKFGRIYAGSGRGIDQVNLETKEVKHFNSNDGLPGGDVNLSKTDKTGAIWFGSPMGIAKFVPEADKPRQPPNIFISGLRVAGDSQKISELGESILPDAEFTADKNNLAINYLGLGASLGEDLKYQYQLSDENSEWITTNERTLNFANLSAGDYKFAVRAITSDGLISPNPATFSFKILRPIYLRWWFLVLASLIVGLAIRQLYRVRVRRLLEIERTRTRIATDLHDDIGSDLSKISLLSEVVKMQMKNGNEENNRLLTTIAETSRKSVDSMRDIVWAINPSRDSFNDLVKKMRLFAEESLVEKNIKLIFNAPNDNQKLKLSMDTRRELYLIFKEAVNNAAKYSNCSQVEINFSIIGKEISLNIKDNGKGFNVSQEFDGNGLNNMKRRCENLKGKFELTSSQAHGTNISANFPQV